MCFIVKVLPWIHSVAAKSEMTHHHLFSDDWVYCQLNSECVSGQCEGGVCLQSLTQSNLEKLGPSPGCKENEQKPCQECVLPACNQYGNACLCPQSKMEEQKQSKREEKLSADKRLFVIAQLTGFVKSSSALLPSPSRLVHGLLSPLLQLVELGESWILL